MGDSSLVAQTTQAAARGTKRNTNTVTQIQKHKQTQKHNHNAKVEFEKENARMKNSEPLFRFCIPGAPSEQPAHAYKLGTWCRN